MRARNRPEFEFSLPKGLIVARVCHSQGKMRLATGKDELLAREHPRVRENPHYAWLALLSQTIAGLGSLQQVEAEQLENLALVDSVYLRNFYRQLDPWQGDDSPVGESRFIPSTDCIAR